MKQEYLIKIGEIFITEDGLNTGRRYGSEFENLDALQKDFTETKAPPSFRNQAYFFVTPNANKSSMSFSITFAALPFDLLEDLTQLMRQSKADLEDVEVLLTNPYNSNFSHSLLCNIDSITYGEMLEEYFLNVRINLTTTGLL